MSLDPADRGAFRELAHRALDDALDAIEQVADGPAWQPVPDGVKAAIAADPLPYAGQPLAGVYADYERLVAPYASGNRHPRFFGWVNGAGTPSGVVAALLTAALNVNAGGRDHAAVYVERRLIAWCAELFGFPADASGIVTTGSSMANLISVLVARRAAFGADVRRRGLGAAAPPQPVAYASRDAHGSLAQSFDIAGFGSSALRAIPLDAQHRMDCTALEAAIARDRAAGCTPFAVIGTAGSASTGAVDDLAAIAAICARERLWFHVDGAFGAFAILDPALRPLVAGIERADSLAFDFHKWLQVPYDAGCVLVRDAELHRSTFAGDAPYLARFARGTAGGAPWFTDFGPELSRSFRALGAWFALKEFGLERFAALVARQCALAQSAAALIDADPRLERLAPVALTIVCFRYRGDAAPAVLDDLNAEIVAHLQLRGIAVPSTTRVDGSLAIRMNVMNHRTTAADIATTLTAVAEAGAELSGEFPAAVRTS